MKKTSKTTSLLLLSIFALGFILGRLDLNAIPNLPFLAAIGLTEGMANSGRSAADKDQQPKQLEASNARFPAAAFVKNQAITTTIPVTATAIATVAAIATATQTPRATWTAFPTQAPSWTPAPTQPPTATPLPTLSPELESFIGTVSDGSASVVRGVYVDNVLKLPVIQQPKGDWAFVSLNDGETTQFQSAAANGVTGILAHNFLSGRYFFNLQLGQTVDIVYGDGHLASYKITDMHRYQKLDPKTLYSRFIDLTSGENISSSDLFNREYTGAKRVEFQTCIEKDGEGSWGLLFVIATPIN